VVLPEPIRPTRKILLFFVSGTSVDQLVQIKKTARTRLAVRRKTGPVGASLALV
jgi:hypothetical protein